MRYFSSFVLPIVGLIAQALPSSAATSGVLPWGQSADQVGWETFVQVTAPSGAPGSANVEFETWASDDDIYQTSPPKWPTGSSPKKLHPSLLNVAISPSARIQSITPGACIPPGNAAAGRFPENGCIGEEVRRNWATFQYIVGNNLFSRKGLAAAAQSGFKVDLPADAIEVKGDWVKLSDLKSWLENSVTDAQIRSLYHVNSVEESTGKTEYALVAFHFSTKQIKSWIWADFEHELTPGRCDDIGCHDSFGAVEKDVPPKNSRAPDGSDVNGNQSYGQCAKNDVLEAMMANAGIGPEWRHYCLKATQIDFVNVDKSPSLVGNSVIERIAADIPVLRSSCITCHAFASFDKNGKPGGFPSNGPIGPFDPSSINGRTQNDFIWGNLLAR